MLIPERTWSESSLSEEILQHLEAIFILVFGQWPATGHCIVGRSQGHWKISHKELEGFQTKNSLAQNGTSTAKIQKLCLRRNYHLSYCQYQRAFLIWYWLIWLVFLFHRCLIPKDILCARDLFWLFKKHRCVYQFSPLISTCPRCSQPTVDEWIIFLVLPITVQVMPIPSSRSSMCLIVPLRVLFLLSLLQVTTKLAILLRGFPIYLVRLCL